MDYLLKQGENPLTQSRARDVKTHRVAGIENYRRQRGAILKSKIKAEKKIVLILQAVKRKTGCEINGITVYHNSDEPLEVEIFLDY